MSSDLSAEDYRLAASLMESSVTGAPNPELMALAARLLRAAADGGSDYFRFGKLSRRFHREAEAAITLVCREKSGSVRDLHDKAFTVLECYALVVRESSLASGEDGMPPGHRELMDFFEQCGLWSEGDGSLVTEFYYRRIPAKATGN